MGARCTHTCTHAGNKAATELLASLPNSVFFPCVSACPRQSLKVRGMKPHLPCARDAGRTDQGLEVVLGQRVVIELFYKFKSFQIREKPLFRSFHFLLLTLPFFV